MKTITLCFDPEKGISTNSDQPITFEEFLFITSNSNLAFAKKIVEDTPEEHKLEAKKTLYDLINLAASNVLRAFAPEIEMHPTLTEDAILRAENEIIEESTPEDLHARYDGI